MPEITIDDEATCAKCGKRLSYRTSVTYGAGVTLSLSVEPCEVCMDLVYEQGLRDAEAKEKEEP